MNKKALAGVGLVIGILAIYYILRTIPIKEVLILISNARFSAIAGYAVSSLIIMFVLAWRWSLILKSQNHHVGMIRLILYRLVGYGVSYLTPSAKLGGEPIRAALLSKHGRSFSESLSSVVIDKTIEVASHALFFFIGALIILFRFALPEQTEITMLLFAIAFLAFIIFIYKRMVSGKGVIASTCRFFRLNKFKKIKKSEKKIEQFEQLIIKFFKHDKRDFFMAVILSFFSWVFMFFEYWFIGKMIGYDLSFPTIFLMTTVVGIAFLIPIPMALGSLEAGQVMVFNLTRGPGSSVAGMAVSFITRARDLLWSLLAILLLFYFGIGQTFFKKKKL
jgi:glycosyltransferase 2 family protein